MKLEDRGPSRQGRWESPSAWSHRLPIVGLALVGCALATYLTLYQWHLTANVWDPIFGSRSSEAVLTSAISRSLPVPDAALGAFGYLTEAILALVGGPSRWSASPWLVALFALVAACLALTSLVLVLSQVLLVQALCILCLCSACGSFVNAWLARDEAGATLGYLRRAHAEGRSVWRLFWGGARARPAQEHGKPM